MSRALRYGFIGALALGGVLLFLLASASSNVQAFERHYPLLLAINGAVALLLFVFVIALVVRVVRRYRARRFGARLMARFALAFALMGVLPGVLIYVVSVQFLSRTVESWFNVRVDRALESGLSLGRAALEAQLADVTSKARVIALELADAPESAQLAVLDRARERAGIQEALLITATGQVIGTAGGMPTELAPELPSAAQMRQARLQRGFSVIEGDPLATEPRSGLRTRVIMPIPSSGPDSSRALDFSLGAGASSDRGARALLPRTSEQRFLQLIQRVPASVAANAEGLQSGYRDYQELSLSRVGLQRIYTVTLTLTRLLAIFAAIASGVLLASSMTAPLLQVAEGTKAVAEGDFRPVREFAGSDELNLLTQSFNAMTRQLAEARDAVEKRSRELENARAFLERVLTNLSAGVLVLDKDFRLVTANYGASLILGLPLASRTHERLDALAPRLAEQVGAAFGEQALAAEPNESWQRQIELPRVQAAGEGEPLALLVRGSPLPLDDGPGYVVVFDDITQVISAQRAVAWGEVARRLAHEIKNPLTPIQLAAERLQMKLADKLPPEQASVLVRGAATIVSQVAAMKRMVDDFRKYAAVPPADLVPLDLNPLIEEVAQLYESGSPTNGGGITLQLESGLPRIEGDETQLRQIIHNLIVNAQDALSLAPAERPSRIILRTETVTVREPGAAPAAAVRLTVEDNGPGFAAHILKRAFEPYVTSKPNGTGLGLAMVKKIVDEHGARVELFNRTGGNAGASVVIVFRRLAATADTRNSNSAKSADDAQRRVRLVSR